MIFFSRFIPPSNRLKHLFSLLNKRAFSKNFFVFLTYILENYFTLLSRLFHSFFPYLFSFEIFLSSKKEKKIEIKLWDCVPFIHPTVVRSLYLLVYYTQHTYFCVLRKGSQSLFSIYSIYSTYIFLIPHQKKKRKENLLIIIIIPAYGKCLTYLNYGFHVIRLIYKI